MASRRAFDLDQIARPKTTTIRFFGASVPRSRNVFAPTRDWRRVATRYDRYAHAFSSANPSIARSRNPGLDWSPTTTSATPAGRQASANFSEQAQARTTVPAASSRGSKSLLWLPFAEAVGTLQEAQHGVRTGPGAAVHGNSAMPFGLPGSPRNQGLKSTSPFGASQHCRFPQASSMCEV